ncbi:VQ motif-containing protein 9-like [Cornus florida]|uniref:VQ motif-containing protein 9-like n=1 Tax=Cornus florida TaxID=4283 RepID=UPI0028A27161|nr:VQ motif-containing protein 9-like [Cornus florida]
MDNTSCHSSGDSTTTHTSTSTNRDQQLKHLNRISHKISKTIIRKPTFDDHHHRVNHQPPPPPPPEMQSQPQNLQQQQQHQPPVYNINKSDFREVVQKLTGLPAHERFATPPPVQASKPQSSRLQRIRPPPLAHLSCRPPPLLNNATINPNNPAASGCGLSTNFINNQRPATPLSPLPPFPAVQAAAESPISAYMRYLQSSISTTDSDSNRFPANPPRWNNLPQSQLLPHQQHVPPPQQNIVPSPTRTSMAQSQFSIPSSPLPFGGCLPSPRSPYPLLSPRMPVPSPRWTNL